MAKMRTLMALVLAMAVCSMAAAEWVPLPGDPVRLSELEQPYIVGDKAFSDFEITGTGNGGALAPDASSIYVRGGQETVSGDYGLEFVLSLLAGTGQEVSAKLTFKVAVTPEADMMIKDVSGFFPDVSATGSGVVGISETVLNGPATEGDIIAQLEFSKQEDDGGVNLKDSADFEPVKEIWITKDISISGGDADNGSAHISGFFQLYSQVPEPATMCLLALGGLPLLRRRR